MQDSRCGLVRQVDGECNWLDEDRKTQAKPQKNRASGRIITFATAADFFATSKNGDLHSGNETMVGKGKRWIKIIESAASHLLNSLGIPSTHLEYLAVDCHAVCFES